MKHYLFFAAFVLLDIIDSPAVSCSRDVTEPEDLAGQQAPAPAQTDAEPVQMVQE